MALLKLGFETLVDSYGTERTGGLKELREQSRELAYGWKDHVVTNEGGAGSNLVLDENMSLTYRPVDGRAREAQLTDFAFSQLAQRMGVPAAYITKCLDAGKVQLALDNYRSWANDFDKGVLVRENKGVVRAVLSDSYSPYDSFQIMSNLEYTVPSKYELSAAHLSEDRLHLRFVDYNKLPINDKGGSDIFAGFTVDSSDVGRGALSVKFFLYRFACRNGVVMSSGGGVLYRQSHVGSAMNDSKIAVFNRAFLDMDKLAATAVDLVGKKSAVMLKDYEVSMYLEKARRDMQLSKKSMERLDELMGVYGTTQMGIINSVAELAQDFTLDTRVDMESWAGNMLTRAA